MTDAQAQGYQARVMVQVNGTPEDQRLQIIDFICNHFENSEKWPLTDEERITFIRKLCGHAQTLRRTEAALSQPPTHNAR